MVTFDEVDDSSSPPSPPPPAPSSAAEDLPSQSRLLDAEAIEEVAQKMTRISARMHLESLAKKLRKESEALKRVEKSKQTMSKENESDNTTTTAQASAVEEEEEAMDTITDEKKAVSSSLTNIKPSVPVVAVISPSAKFIPVDHFSFDSGGYNSPFVTLYVPLPGVGSIARELVTCEFSKSSFDLIVRNLKGDGKSSYRLYKKDDLEHDIDDTKSKIIVKADKVIVKLAKVKKEYGGFDYWTKLTDTKGRNKAAGAAKENPQDSIMNLMKDMYEQGDDNMKKMIGETMMKQQRGELNHPDMKSMGGGKAGAGGGLGDLNFDDEEF